LLIPFCLSDSQKSKLPRNKHIVRGQLEKQIANPEDKNKNKKSCKNSFKFRVFISFISSSWTLCSIPGRDKMAQTFYHKRSYSLPPTHVVKE
jgi:hypothetical protein